MSNMTIKTDEVKSLIANAYVKEDYNFIGWSTTPDGDVEYKDGASYLMGTESTYTLYAVWEEQEKYTVEFNSNGGTSVETQYVLPNGKVTEPVPPTKKGYTFDGWYVGNEKWSFVGYIVTEPMVLNAKWNANENVLVFDANGAQDGSMSSITVKTDTEITLPANTYIKPGYTFKGWSTVADGEVVYQNSSLYLMGAEGINIIYAVWEANTNTISFIGSSNTTGTMDDIKAKTGEKIILPDNQFEKPGYKFQYWYADDSIYYPGDEYTVGTDANISIYAIWEANTNKLYFNANGGSGSMTEINVKTDQAINLPVSSFTNQKNKFVGWALTPDGEAVYSDGGIYTMGTESSYTLYAVWLNPSTEALVAQKMSQYRGETVNILAATWTNGEAGAPWSQVELCVTDWELSANGYGTTINNGVMERNEYIENTYGVTLNWINCGGAGMLNRLTQAAMNKGKVSEEIIHVALPHTFEAMQIVVDDAVYAMNKGYINFEASYYNQDSVNQYTLAGNTFFVGGDISFLDEQTAYVLFFNNAIAADFGSSFPNLYQAVLDGTWTIDTLYNLAGAVSDDIDGNGVYNDYDMYGLGITGLANYFQYFGVYQVGKSKDSFGNEVFALTIENDKVQAIVEEMLYAKENVKSIRTSWGSAGEPSWEAISRAFAEDRLLFYSEVLQKTFSIDISVDYGILPFPKLSTSQDRYYVPSCQQTTIACVPRATNDRELSECMIEILSKTASEYIMPSYYESIRDTLNNSHADDTMQIIIEQISPNLMYDIGYNYGRYGGDGSGLITSSVQYASIEGNVNNFTNALDQGRTQAEKTLGDWSYAYNVYDDEY